MKSDGGFPPMVHTIANLPLKRLIVTGIFPAIVHSTIFVAKSIDIYTFKPSVPPKAGCGCMPGFLKLFSKSFACLY